MKYELHVPVEQYGFVAGTIETADVQEVRTAYEQIRRAFSETPGLPDKELTDYIYRAVNKLGNTPEQMEALHPMQRQAIKCYYNALNRKQS